MGTYYISNIDADTTTVRITGQDARYLLTTRTKAVTFNTTQSVGVQFTALMNSTGLPFQIDTALNSVFLPIAQTFGTDYTLLQILVIVLQYATMDIWADRSGTLQIGKRPNGTAGIIEKERLTEWANIRVKRPYNYLRVVYGTASGQFIDTDLRGANTSNATNILIINNPFVTTLGDAQRIRDYLVPRMALTNARAGRMMGDPAIDCADNMQIETRFIDDPGEMPETLITGLDYTYNGLLTCRIEGYN